MHVLEELGDGGMVAEEAAKIVGSSTPADAVPAVGDTSPTVDETIPTTKDTTPPTGDTVPTTKDATSPTGDTIPPTKDATPHAGDTALVNGTAAPATGENVPAAAETVTTKITSALNVTPVSDDEVKEELQESVLRTKTDFSEVMNKTGTVVQKKLIQSVQDAKVAVGKVVSIAGSSRAKVAESVAASKSLLQNATLSDAGNAIMNLGGTVLGSPVGDTSIEQNSPTRKRAEAALTSPKEDASRKQDIKETPAGPGTTDASPKDAPPKEVPENMKVDVKLENIKVDVKLDNISPKSGGSNISPIPHLPNLAEEQFDAPLADIPMPTSLMEFTQEHWDTLCHNNNILKGVRMEDTGPNPSIANLIEPLTMNDIHYALNDISRTEYTTTYTERSSKYANHGWTTKALLLTIPWVDSSASAEQEELLASSKEVKTVYTNVFQRYPFVTIGIKRSSLKPSEDFMKDITNALAQPTERKQAALNKVFSIYGHAFQMEFDVGALMVKTSSTTTSVEMSQEKWEEKVGFEFKAIISKVPVPPYVKGGGMGEKGKNIDDSSIEQDSDKKQVYELRGGNARLGPNAWIHTIADYTTWRVIKTSDVIPVIDILPPEIRDEIEKLAPQSAKPAAPLRGKWVDAIEHVANHRDEVDAKWLKLHRPETGSTGEWFFLGQSLDRNKALMVKETEPGALGTLSKAVKIWDNEEADTTEKQAIWDFFPANPEHYVSLGSYFESKKKQGGRPGAPPSFKVDPIKNIRAVRKDLVVEATLGEKTYWDNDTGTSKARSKACMWEVVKATSEKDDAPEVIETHLFKAFKGGPSHRADHVQRSVYLLKKSAIEIIDGDYEAPTHQHTVVGESRVPEVGCLRTIGIIIYKTLRSWLK